jgi:hypothetical protein
MVRNPSLPGMDAFPGHHPAQGNMVSLKALNTRGQLSKIMFILGDRTRDHHMHAAPASG